MRVSWFGRGEPGPSQVRRNADMLDAVPRLKRQGRIQFGGAYELADQGWTADDVARLCDAFPDASFMNLTLVVSLAAPLQREGVAAEVDDVVAWLCAIFVAGPDGQIRLRPVLRDEAARARRDRTRLELRTVPQRWAEAAGSVEAGLAALAADLSVEQIKAQGRR